MVWVASFLTIGVLYFLLIRPQEVRKTKLENELMEKREIYQNAKKASSRDSKSELAKQIEKKQEEIFKYCINSDSLEDMPFEVIQIGKVLKIESSSIKGSKETEKISNCDVISEGYIDIDFQSGFNRFAKFLNALERHEPLLLVDGFHIQRNEEDLNKNDVHLEVSVLVAEIK